MINFSATQLLCNRINHDNLTNYTRTLGSWSIPLSKTIFITMTLQRCIPRQLFAHSERHSQSDLTTKQRTKFTNKRQKYGNFIENATLIHEFQEQIH